MKRTAGFTVIELIVAIVFLAAASLILLQQRQSLLATQRDDARKTAVNAMYYSLEEVFYAKNGHYPSKVDEGNLSSMDPTLFTDPDGEAINTGKSDYRYEPTNCDISGKCKSYKLRALLEKEADYIKENRQK